MGKITESQALDLDTAPSAGQVDAVIGGIVRERSADTIDPAAENAFWEKNFLTRPYYQEGTSYGDYRPAYQIGWESRSRFGDRGLGRHRAGNQPPMGAPKGGGRAHLGAGEESSPGCLGPRQLDVQQRS